MRQTTEEALAEALETLLLKRSIEKISVKDIAAQCGVNRQTFYYHFHDIYDLIEWTLVREIESYIDLHFEKETDWQEKIRLLFHYFYLHKPVILHAYDSTNRIQYERIMVKRAAETVGEIIELYPQAQRVPEDKREFICMIYARGITALFLEWVEAGMPDERHVKLEDYFVIMDGSMENALEKFLK